MPLVRFEVRNEVGLGDPELYGGGGGGGKRGEAEPKALLEGIAVSGLVGILRQLGDLAEFAADVFHDLHEQVITTSARGRKVLTRVQNIEAALPSLEKAVKSQMSHIHFSYVAGFDWHAQLQNEQNHLLSSDLPRFMMDSYEECRDPPRLYLLDKFDNSGAGACLKRYSDPSYFKIAWDMMRMDKNGNIQKEKRSQKIKRKGSRLKESYQGQTTSRHRNGELQRMLTAVQQTSRQFASPSTNGLSISEHRSTPHASNPEIASRSSSFGSKARLSLGEPALDLKPAVSPDENGHSKPFDVKLQYKLSAAPLPILLNGTSAHDSNDDSKQGSLPDEMVARSPSVKWDEKAEIVMSTGSIYCDDVVMDKAEDAEPVRSNPGQKEVDHRELENLEQQEALHQKAKLLLLSSGLKHHDEVPSETDNYMDALNTLESETETESECQTKNQVKLAPSFNFQVPQAGGTENLVSQHPDSSVAELPDTCTKSCTSHTSNRTADFNNLSNVGPSEILEPVLSAYTAIPPDKGSSVVKQIPEFNTEGLSGDSIDEGTSCVVSCEPTVSNVQANEPFNRVSAAEGSPADTTDDSPVISESRAQHYPEKGDGEGVGCGSACVSDMQTISLNVLVDKEPEIQDLPTDTVGTSLGASSIKLWTNAGLFGLEPSKPPVFGAQDGLREEMLPGCKEPQYSHSTDCTELHCPNVGESAVVDVPNGNSSITSSFVGKLVGVCPTSANHNSSGANQSATRTPDMVRTDWPLDRYASFEHSEHNNMIGKHSSISELLKSEENTENGGLTYPATDMAERNNVPVVSNLLLASNNDPGYNYSFDSSKSISTSFSSIAQRFLANTLQRRTSPKYTDLPTSSGRVKSGASAADESLNHNVAPNETVFQPSQFEEKTEKGMNGLPKTSIFSSSHYSEKSSPPLEYMKISFHPISASEMSKLNLEFSDGNLHENSDDLMLPTFQLPPGSSVPLPGSGSESEDDTFGRSYSYSSYDDLSPRLYSNSELWDQEEGVGLEEHELYDNPNQTRSSITSISSHMGFEQTNFSSMKTTDAFAEMGAQDGLATLDCHPTGELPNFDTLMSKNNQQNENAFMSQNSANLQLDENRLPPPPPLPPIQWRVTKPTSLEEDTGTKARRMLKKTSSLPPTRTPTIQEEHPLRVAPSFSSQHPPGHAEDVHDQKAEMVKELSHLPDIIEMRSSLLQQIRDKSDPQKLNGHEKPKVVGSDISSLDEREESLQQIRSKPDQQKLNGHEKPKAVCSDINSLDEREELLQQIRGKTFNLRRTNASKSNTSPQSTTNSNVVAILEKANAIRQAVASDEGGDDDNWSDV